MQFGQFLKVHPGAHMRFLGLKWITTQCFAVWLMEAIAEEQLGIFMVCFSLAKALYILNNQKFKCLKCLFECLVFRIFHDQRRK